MLPGVVTTLVGQEWINARLAGDATLRSILSVPAGQSRVAMGVAPSAWGAGPFVTFSPQVPMADVFGTGSARIMGAGEWLVRAGGMVATDKGTPSAIAAANARWGAVKAAAKRIDALLHGATGTTADGEVIACVRVEDHFMPSEERPGEVFYFLGGQYRVEATGPSGI